MKKYNEFVNEGFDTFNSLITDGDNNVKSGKYADAITNYKNALGIRPNNTDSGHAEAVSKLAEAEKLLAGASSGSSGTNGTSGSSGTNGISGTDPVEKDKIQKFYNIYKTELINIWKKIIN